MAAWLCRRAEMSEEELWWDEKGWAVLGWNQNRWKQLRNLLRWHVRRDGMRWGRAEMRWDEMKCGVWCVKCEERSLKCEESVRLALHCNVVARRSCSWTATAHGACKFYRWKRFYRFFYSISISQRQLPPPRAGTAGIHSPTYRC